MTDLHNNFIKKWHTAIDERNLEKVDALLASDMKLISPVVFKPFTDRAYILKVLENVIGVLENFRYTRSAVLNDGGILLIFEGEIDGKTLEGIDLIDLDSEGKVKTLKVMVRPFKLYTKLVFSMAERLGFKSIKMSFLKFLLR